MGCVVWCEYSDEKTRINCNKLLNRLSHAFLDTSVTRELERRQTTSVYRKPIHADHYLVYDLHHPKRMKRKSSVISEEKKQLSSILVSANRIRSP